MRSQSMFLTLVAAAGLSMNATAATAFTALITADNAYMLFTGDSNSVGTFEYGEVATLASQIYTPETFSFNLPDNGYIYIAAWSDGATHQGVMTKLTSSSQTIRSGDTGWEVFATGIDRDPNTHPATLASLSLADVTTQIGIANTGSLWEAPAVSAPNPGDVLSIAIGGGFDGTDRWMWHDLPGVSNDFSSPTTESSEYLIFRISVSQLVVPAPAAALAAAPALAFLAGRRRR